MISKIGIFSFLSLVTLFLLSSCADKGPKVFKEKNMPDLGVTIKVTDEWNMTVKSADKGSFKNRLSYQPEYIFAPMTAAKGDPTPDDLSRTMNWRFIGLKGEFDPEMSVTSPDFPKPDGLYFVDVQKGELLEQRQDSLPWPGANGIKAVSRLYEETHGTGGTSDIWHAFTVTFNYNGNAYEFNTRIPSETNTRDWTEAFWASIADLQLTAVK